MNKIPSFTIDHNRLVPGVYVSRQDVTPQGDILTTFDVRMTAPNRQPPLSPEALHAMEHLAATYLRNDAEWASKMVYWGPMGCCTGNYLILQGDILPADVLPVLRRMFAWIANFDDDIPGAKPRDCGNYSFMDLSAARQAARHYLQILDAPVTEYPR